MDVAPRDCACGLHPTVAAFSCRSCGRSWSRADMVYPGEETPLEIETTLEGPDARACDYVQRLIAAALSCAVTGFFAIAGAFTGALTGALASRASDCGFLRGTGVGAIAGAVLSIEVLEASRAYWSSQQSGTRTSSPMADFIDELLRGRFTEEPFSPTIFRGHHWHVRVSTTGHSGMHDVYGESPTGGLSQELLNKLPCCVIMEEHPKSSQSVCCPICLQDFKVGEMARSLPHCLHKFHMACVDKWLSGHGSCPICRRAL